jgi:hypothetical protein
MSFHTYWRHWHFGKTFRMNGTMWGYNPYTSYRFGPFELRKYSW